MNITLVTVGKIKEKYFKDAIAEYSKRLSRYCKLDIVEVADEKTPDNASEVLENQIKQKEAERILKYIREDSYCIALAIDGKKYNSMDFARHIEKLGVSGKSSLSFVIGGSLGLHDSVLKRANEKISFSDMTFPHQLMRVILLEQVYRGYRIINNEPYHK
jgi:23S rRNA (pseudouridine1915-N3)-methyltransferase